MSQKTSPKENGDVSSARSSPKNSGEGPPIPETVAPSDVYPLREFPEKAERTYSMAEFLSFALYIALSIVLPVIAGIEFAHHEDPKLNDPAKKWDASSKAFTNDVAPEIKTNWSVAPATGSAFYTSDDLQFSVQEVDVQVPPFAETYTSVYLQADVAASVISAASNVLTIVLQTNENNLTISRTISLEDDSTSYILQSCVAGSTCASNTTQACIDAYGAKATAPRPVNGDSSLNCTVPTYTGRSCIILQSRRDDTGATVWWGDFDLDGCEWPFTESSAESTKYIRTTDTIPIKIYTNTDPEIQKKVLSEGRTFAIEIIRGYQGNSPNPFLAERHDRTPEAVGIALLSLVFIIGSIIMGLKLIPFAIRYSRKAAEERQKEKKDQEKKEASPTQNSKETSPLNGAGKQSSLREVQNEEEMKKKEQGTPKEEEQVPNGSKTVTPDQRDEE